jgi:hypothetical protein
MVDAAATLPARMKVIAAVSTSPTPPTAGTAVGIGVAVVAIAAGIRGHVPPISARR